jgi:acyl dehydratase
VSPAPWSPAGAGAPIGEPSTVPARATWDEVEVGTKGEPFVAPELTVTDSARYQGASGDMNPIHHDDSFAKASGYPGTFTVGMHTAGVMGIYVTDWFGARAIRQLKTQFREQAWPGDVITYAGEVTGKREENGERLLELTLTATRQTGGLHLKGSATVSV